MGKVHVAVEYVTVVNRKDELRKEDAYLWVLGIQVLAPSGDPGFEFLRRKPALPGNVGGGFKRGERRAVPAAVGTFDYEQGPVGKQALFGVAVIAWDHDRAPEARIQSAYEQSARLIDREIRAIIDANLTAGPDPVTGELPGVTPADERRIRDGLEDLLKRVMLPSGILSLDTIVVDDFVGGERVLLAVDDATRPAEQAFTLDLRKRENVGAHYRVTGRLRWTP